MNNYKHIITLVIFSFSCIFVLLNSCKKDETPENTVADRLFRPASFKSYIDGSQVYFSWTPIAGASYLLEISKDSFLFKNDLQTFTLDAEDEFEVEDLWSNTRYSARIKSVSLNKNIKDSDYKEITFVTGIENIFYQPKTEDITTTSLLLSWIKGKKVSKIVISTTDAGDKTITLSESEISAGKVLLDGLTPATSYVFKIYNQEMLRGKITVKTRES
ncbi:MAG: hypothetical protein AB2L20_18770 [Mangrovibacterium sp.]